MPEWWPKNHPFSSVRNSNRKLLLSIIEAYKSKDSGKEDNNTRDRSPIASPERSNHVDDDVVSSDVLSQATPEIIDSELFNNDPPSFSDESFADILPLSNPEGFFPHIPDTPISSRRIQGIF